MAEMAVALSLIACLAFSSLRGGGLVSRRPSIRSAHVRAAIEPPATVGFIGLGIMGLGQANNLLKVGFNLVVWNRDIAKAENLVAAHPPGRVRIASSPRDVVTSCELTYAMLSTPEASQAVFGGPEGMLAGVSTGKMIVDCATLTPARMAEMASAVAAKGGSFLEAPVSGSKKPAADGALIFLTAGSEDVLSAARPGLEAMGKATHYYGSTVGVGALALARGTLSQCPRVLRRQGRLLLPGGRAGAFRLTPPPSTGRPNACIPQAHA